MISFMTDNHKDFIDGTFKKLIDNMSNNSFSTERQQEFLSTHPARTARGKDNRTNHDNPSVSRAS